MSALSDQLLVAAILIYVAAMIAFAAENALRRDSPVAARPASALAGQVMVAEAPVKAGRGVVLAGRAGVAGVSLAALSQAGSVVTRGLAAERVPWGNMYEFILVVVLVGVVAWLVVAGARPAARPLGLYVSLTAVVLLGLAGMRVYASAGPLVPALNSYWLKIHVSSAAVATGIFLIGFIASALHLLRSRYDNQQRARGGLVDALGRHLPETDRLERLSFRMHAFGFPIWTFAVLAGAIWAEAAWGRYWGWDPKEIWAFISWVVYACYLHARATPSVRRTTTSWIVVLGWATMMFNLFAVNLVIAGLHSYAGTD